MQLNDVPSVAAIERQVFPMPWTASAFAYEVQANPHSYYFVARPRRPQPAPSFQGKLTSALNRLKDRKRGADILGYGGFWLMVDEAHISTLAVRSEYRRQGIGELLLIGLIDWAGMVNASVMTLEVRSSNLIAQSLYRKYGFETVGLRKGYYSDNAEDALIMTTGAVNSQPFQSNLARLKDSLRVRLDASQRIPLAC